jgi:membrane protein implicated in regulation of membrane protease activity
MLSETWSFLTAWYNLPFTLMVFTCMLLATLQVMGLSAEQDADVDADVDVDVDADVDVDVDADVAMEVDTDLDGDVDGDGDFDHDADVDGGSGLSSLALLAFLGVGKAPLLVVLMILLGAAGIFGWLLNSLAESYLRVYSAPVLALVLPLSLGLSSVLTSRTARFIGRALPPVSTTATRAHALVGRRGVVTSPFVDHKYGLVRLRDAGGTLISVFAIIDDEIPIERQSEVVLVAYDLKSKRYTVTRS